MAKIVYLGLGSNLKNPKYQIKTALKTLSNQKKIRILAVSSLYQSAAVGNINPQPDYFNRVVQISTHLTPWALLKLAQKIENQQGRIRKEHWGSRTLDIDILLYGAQIIHRPLLDIPHPRLHLRAFVVQPLNEVNPTLKIPKINTTLTDLIQKTKNQKISKLENPIF